MRLLLDEMLAPVIAEQLRVRAHDVVAVAATPELRGRADADLFEYAQRERRVVATYNREDFMALDRQYRHVGREHQGIVILNPRRFPQGAASIGPLVTSIEALLVAAPRHPAFVHWLQ